MLSKFSGGGRQKCAVVQSINRDGYTIGLDKKAEGTLLKKDVIRDEERSIQLHKHIRAIITEVKDSPRGPLILLSRVDRKFLYRLLEIDVPEIFHGIVEVRSIAREPGARAKIAVSATQAGIDPVGACVGMQGKRIQPIVKELCGEKIDVIEWNPDPALFIAKAISPAKVIGVYLSGGRNTTVVVPDDQLSLAIGKDGQNARLAAKLTNWRIDIKSVSEAAADILAAYDAQEDYTIPDPEQDKRVVMLAWDSYFVEGKETPDEIRAGHPPAHRHGGHLSGRKIPAQKQGQGTPGAAGAALGQAGAGTPRAHLRRPQGSPFPVKRAVKSPSP